MISPDLIFNEQLSWSVFKVASSIVRQKTDGYTSSKLLRERPEENDLKQNCFFDNLHDLIL